MRLLGDTMTPAEQQRLAELDAQARNLATMLRRFITFHDAVRLLDANRPKDC